MAVVNEVITKFGYQGSVTPLDNFNKGLGDSIKLMTASAVALAGSAVAFGAWIRTVSAGIGTILHLSDETGVAVEAIQELEFVASVTGSSAQALGKSLAEFSVKIGEAAQRGNEAFQRLGVSVRGANGQIKSTDDLLSEVGARFKQLNLSVAEQTSFAQQMGIDRSMLNLMRLTTGEMAKLRAEGRALGIVTREEAEAAERLNDAQVRTNAAYQAISRLIAVSVAPAMSDMTLKLYDFIAANKDLIKGALDKVIEFVTELTAAMIRLAPFVLGIALAFGIAKVATLGWAGALALLNIPLLIWTAGIIAAALVVDDLIVAFQGGESIIAGKLQDWFGWDIRPSLTAMVDAVKYTFRVFKKLFTEDFTAGLYDIFIRPFNQLFSSIGAKMSDLLGSIKTRVAGLLPDWAVKLLGGGTIKVDVPVFPRIESPDMPRIGAPEFPRVESPEFPRVEAPDMPRIESPTFPRIESPTFPRIEAPDMPRVETPTFPRIESPEFPSIDGSDMSRSGSPTSLAPRASVHNERTTTNNVTQDINIEIKTDNPQVAARFVENGLQEQLKDAKTQFARGGA